MSRTGQPRPLWTFRLGTIAMLAALLPAAPVHAQALMSVACSTANLLAGKRPIQWQDVRGNMTLVTDEANAPEGAQWDSPVAITWDTGAGSVTYDLGQPTTLSAFHVQADANDTYKILGSDTGAPGSFHSLIDIDIVEGDGLRSRDVRIPPATARFLRIGEGVGDGFYSLSEFAAYCQAPTPFPPKFRTVDAPLARVVKRPWYTFDWWQDKPSARLEMVLAIAALLLLAWGTSLQAEGRPDEKKQLRDRLLMVVGVLSFASYFNFGAAHFGNYVHTWDTYHYYIGSKYFPELSYDRLYECASVADSEDPQLRRRVELRKIMNLRTNVLGSTNDILAHPDRCKAHFAPQRWEAFKHDVAYFRNRLGVKRWEEAQTDHGYNGTPVWNILGTTLSNLSPASDLQIDLLDWFDPLFVVGMTALLWWAFGWRTLCVALAVFGTNFPSRFYWTGGSFLRWDWLLYMTAGVCFLKKERPVLGGFCLMYSALLRVFPVFLFMGPFFALADQAWRLWRARKPGEGAAGVLRGLDRRYLRLFGGGALAFVVLVPISLGTSSGIAGYKAFFKNTEKHANTPLTNYMGWRTVVAYRTNEAGRFLRTDRLEDPWKDWKDARLRAFHRSRPVYVFGVLAFSALLALACRGRDPWVTAALSASMIAVIPELTCYYYAFLIVIAALYAIRKEVGIALLAITAATGVIDWAPTGDVPKSLGFLRMPTWLDEQYTWMSVVTLAGLGWILYEFAFTMRREAAAALTPAGAAATPGGGTVAVAAASDAEEPAASSDPRPKTNKRRPAGAKRKGGRGSKKR